MDGKPVPEDFDAAVLCLHNYPSDIQNASSAVLFLAEASRQTPAHRARLADKNTLTTLFNLLDSSLNSTDGHGAELSSETVQAILKCIGNACIDNDDARWNIVEKGFWWAKQCLRPSLGNEELKLLTVKVLYNICSDYEPAQQEYYRRGIHEAMIGCDVDVGRLVRDEQSRGPFFELLLWLCSHKREDEDGRQELQTSNLLMYPHICRENDVPAEDFALTVEIALIYLRESTEQLLFIESKAIDKVWQILQDNEDYIREAQATGDEEDVKLLVPFSTSLTWCLSDIAANPGFAENYAQQNDFINAKIIGTIAEGEHNIRSEGSRLMSAACQILGNLLWSVKNSPDSVAGIDNLNAELHRALLNMISTFIDPATLHSVAGLLIQLCRLSSSSRNALWDDPRFSRALERLCGSESKEVRQDGMKLLQLLGKNDARIRERFEGLAKQVTESLVAEQSTAGPNRNAIEAPE